MCTTLALDRGEDKCFECAGQLVSSVLNDRYPVSKKESRVIDICTKTFVPPPFSLKISFACIIYTLSLSVEESHIIVTGSQTS